MWPNPSFTGEKNIGWYQTGLHFDFCLGLCDPKSLNFSQPWFTYKIGSLYGLCRADKIRYCK